MILLIVGATGRAIEIVRNSAREGSFDVRINTTEERPDWVISSSESERADAMRRYRLPGHRVIELQGLANDTGPQEVVVRAAVAKMAEIGRMSSDVPLAASSPARRALPFLTEWATWLAIDDARQKIETHVAFMESKHGAAFKGRMLFVIPELAAFGALSGLLARLSREEHQVHVVVTNPSERDPELAAVGDLYPGLTVGRPPASSDSTWQPLACALRGTSRLNSWPWQAVATGVKRSIDRAMPPQLDVIAAIEERKPDALVVVPGRTGTVGADFVRAARWLGIPSLCLPLRWDDLDSCQTLRQETPETFAVWNDEQRRLATAMCGIPPSNVVVTGALLPSDALERRSTISRAEYCEYLGIDPSRPIILLDAPPVTTRKWLEHFQSWRQLVAESPEPGLRTAAIVVFVQNPEEANAWRRLASTGEIFVARAGLGERRALVRLNESVVAADVVMAADLAVALEAGAYDKPVIALLAKKDRDSELARFCDVYAAKYDWPSVARSTDEAVERLTSILTDSRPPAHYAAGIVRHDGQSAVETLYRLLETHAGRTPPSKPATPPPAWQRLMVLLSAAAARRFEKPSTC